MEKLDVVIFADSDGIGGNPVPSYPRSINGKTLDILAFVGIMNNSAGLYFAAELVGLRGKILANNSDLHVYSPFRLFKALIGDRIKKRRRLLALIIDSEGFVERALITGLFNQSDDFAAGHLEGLGNLNAVL